MKGIIALDIDGTITATTDGIPSEVVQYLGGLSDDGWQLVFITGRTFSWGHRLLQQLTFPYHLAVQNGAAILAMPSLEVLRTRYIDPSVFSGMEQICRDEPTGFVLFTGVEHADKVYYQPQQFSSELLEYLDYRCSAVDEQWVEVEAFDAQLLERVASFKCFGAEASLKRVCDGIESRLGLHVPLIRDPVSDEYFVAQATHPDVNKGQALRDVAGIMGCTGPLIAAGDDKNDKPMLEAADVAVAMETAPAELVDVADIVAPPASRQGIIHGINKAISSVEKR